MAISKTTSDLQAKFNRAEAVRINSDGSRKNTDHVQNLSQQLKFLHMNFKNYLEKLEHQIL